MFSGSHIFAKNVIKNGGKDMKPWYEPLTKQRKTQREYDRAIAKIRYLNNGCSYKLAQLILKKRRLEERLKTTEAELQEERLKPQKKEQREKRGRLPW